jgi:hypothetical protein
MARTVLGRRTDIEYGRLGTALTAMIKLSRRNLRKFVVHLSSKKLLLLFNVNE